MYFRCQSWYTLPAPFCLVPVFIVHMKQGQQLVGPQKLGVDGKDLAKLYERQIQASLIAVNDCLVVFLWPDSGFPAGSGCSGPIQYKNPQCFFRLQVFADHPFAQGIHGFTHFKINESQQIPCINIKFI